MNERYRYKVHNIAVASIDHLFFVQGGGVVDSDE